MSTHASDIRRCICAMLISVLTPIPYLAYAAEQSPSKPEELEEIVVTARKREERVDDAPASVIVMNGGALAQRASDNFEAAIIPVPNLSFNSQGSIQSPQIFSRGIGGLEAIGGVDRQEGVGIFLDDVFLARATAYPNLLLDLDRIELIRGPQATLYGKNVLGGALHLVTHAPGDTLSINGRASGGNLSLQHYELGADAPLGDGTLLTRAAFAYRNRNGFIDNAAGGEFGEYDQWATRAQALAFASARTDLRFSFDYERDNMQGFVFAPVRDALQYRAAMDQAPDEKRELWGVSMKLKHAFDSFDVTSISAFRTYDYSVTLDGDFTAAPLFSQGESQEQWQGSQEFRLTSPQDQALRWLAGAYFFWEDFDGRQTFDFSTVPSALSSRNTLSQTTEHYAVFGELSYALTPRVDLSAGLRYTREEKSGKAAIASPSGTFLFGLPAEVSGDLSSENASPGFTATFKWNPKALTYATISRGFKGGGVSQFLVGDQANRFEAETAWNYELGAKTRWFDGRLSINAAAFYLDWKDQQVLSRVPTPAGNSVRVVTNAAQSSSYGAELEARAKVFSGLDVYAGYGYLHARFDEFLDPLVQADFSGNRLPFSPEHSINAGAQYRRPVGAGIDLVVGLDYWFKDSYFFFADNRFERPPVDVLDVRLGLAGKSWDAYLWGKNILDERYLAGHFNAFGTDLGSPADPATFGVTLRGRF